MMVAMTPPESIFDEYRRIKLEGKNRSPMTIDVHNQAVRDFLRFIKGTDPLSVEEEQVQEWLYSNHYALNTRRTFGQRVKSVYLYAHRKGWMSYDPFVDVEFPKPPVPRPQTIPVEKLREMRDCNTLPGSREELMFYLLAYTGMRRMEIWNLGWDDLTETEHGLSAYVVGKGGYERHVPIHPILEQQLSRHERRPGATVLWALDERGRKDDKRPLSEPTIIKMLDFMWPDRPKDGKHGFHSFRRTVASSLIRNGAQSNYRKLILGWARMDIEERHYMDAATKDMHDTIQLLYRDSPI